MNYTVQEIIQGLLNNDADVFRYLYRHYGGMIVGYVRKNSGSDQDTKEMVQIVLLELWNAVKENRYSESGKLDRFIYIITANTWRDELRRRKTRRSEALDSARTAIADDSNMSLATAIVKDQRIEAIHICLEKLESPCDDFIRLFHLQEQSLKDMSEKLQYDYDNLRKRIFDCRKKLKKLVDRYLAQQPVTHFDI